MRKFLSTIVAIAVLSSLILSVTAHDYKGSAVSDFELNDVLYGSDSSYVPQLNACTLDVDGTTRTYYEYVAKAYQTATPVIYTYIPDGENVETFLNTSGWKETADSSGVTLIFPVVENGKWESEKDLAFWNKLKSIVPTNTRHHNTRQYICGYAEGAEMVQRIALNCTNVFAGVALVNPTDLDNTVFEQAGSQLSSGYKAYKDKNVLVDNSEIYVRDVEESVFILTADSAAIPNTISFWKSADKVGNATSDGNGDTVYTGTQNSAARVVIATASSTNNYYGKEFSDRTWNRLNETRRYRWTPDSSVAFSYDWTQNPNASRKTMKVGRYDREWIEILPNGYTSGNAYPVILALHGSNNDGPQMHEISGLWALAEKENVIVLCPSSLRTTAYNAWNSNFGTSEDNGNGMQDPDFLLALLDQYEKSGMIDSSRVYITGFSNGSFMTASMLKMYPERFAAGFIYSGGLTGGMYSEAKGVDMITPVWSTIGTIEEDTTASCYTCQPRNLEYWTSVNHIEQSVSENTHIGINNTTWYAGDAPYVQTYRDNSGHAMHPGDFTIVWDEMFSHAQRGSNGESIWNDYTVTVTANGTSTSIDNAKRIDGVAFLPLKDAAKVLGADTNSSGSTISVTYAGKQIQLSVDGKQAVEYGGTQYVSAKALYEELGLTCSVKTQPKTSEIKLQASAAEKPAEESPAPAKPAEPAQTPVSGSRTYTVVAGDCLWNISNKFYGTGRKYQVIADANGISNPGKIKVGQVLTIPEL